MKFWSLLLSFLSSSFFSSEFINDKWIRSFRLVYNIPTGSFLDPPGMVSCAISVAIRLTKKSFSSAMSNLLVNLTQCIFQLTSSDPHFLIFFSQKIPSASIFKSPMSVLNIFNVWNIMIFMSLFFPCKLYVRDVGVCLSVCFFQDGVIATQSFSHLLVF